MRALFSNLFLLALFAIPLTSCNSDDDDIIDDDSPGVVEYDLQLSLDDKIHYVQSIDTVFGIVRGNGDYTAIVENAEDKVIVEVVDTLVYVSFLANGSYIIDVTDAKGKSKQVILDVYHKSLVNTAYTMSLEKGSTCPMQLEFGAGGYTIKNIRGASAEVSIVNDEVKVTGVNYGNTYFDIVDKRGSLSEGKIIVVALYDLISANLDIEMVPDQTSSIVLKSGEGNWRIMSDSDDLFKAALIKSNDFNEYDVLQIDTYPDKRGRGFVQLMDEKGDFAYINVYVE